VTEIKLPMLGLTMEEGFIRQWLKRAGEPVRKGEPIFEMESDKALMEVEAAEDGVLLKILVEPEQMVPVGTVVGLLGAPGESSEPRGRKSISPRARRLAEEHGVEWSEIAGTGPEGIITEQDVNARISAKPALPAVRQVIAERLGQSQRERVHIYLTASIDMQEARRLRGGWQPALSYSDLIIKAAATCLSEFPLVNSSLCGSDLLLHANVNIGFAVAVDDETLLVPVLRDADRKPLAEIAAERRLLVDRARARQLRPEEMSGSTFTISNLGAFGVEQFTAIINPPESAILAVGAIGDEPRVVDGVIAVRPVMRVTLGVDHRVIDGALAARFLARLRALLEQPDWN
jgi:pyruvate dehydrogenase E2 component (dihydrolipoamide acetyltransferase)